MNVIDKLNNNKILISGISIYIIAIIQVTLLDIHLPFIISIFSVLLILTGIKYPLFGLFFSFATMNSYFDLVPNDLITDFYISKTWDFGFLYLMIIGIPLVIKNWPLLFSIKYPFYFKFFLLYLFLCFLSLMLTIYKYPFPTIDTIRTFRYHCGYLFILPLTLYFLQINKNSVSHNFYLFLKVVYYLSYVLLILYVFQFFTNIKIFHGYSIEILIGENSYIRSIPNFLIICYFFLWFNILAWIRKNRMLPAGIFYNFLCLISTLFTFTRGIYASVTFSLLIIYTLIIYKKTFCSSRLIFSLIFLIIMSYTAFLSGFLNPFVNRAKTIKEATLLKKDSTFWYRINLVSDRIKMTNNENPLLGLGFVHNKYAYRFGKFEGNYDEQTNEFSLSCSDIAFGDIIYRTGWIGIAIFSLFIVSIINYLITIFKKTYALNETVILEIAVIIELARNVLHMINSDSFTGSTIHNPSLLFGISIFLYNYNYRNHNQLN